MGAMFKAGDHVAYKWDRLPKPEYVVSEVKIQYVVNAVTADGRHLLSEIPEYNLVAYDSKTKMVFSLKKYFENHCARSWDEDFARQLRRAVKRQGWQGLTADEIHARPDGANVALEPAWFVEVPEK